MTTTTLFSNIQRIQKARRHLQTIEHNFQCETVRLLIAVAEDSLQSAEQLLQKQLTTQEDQR